MLDMRPLQSNGWGVSVKADADILAYLSGAGLDLEPWEFLTLRRMCLAYSEGQHSGKDRFGIPPMRRVSSLPPDPEP